MTSPSAAFTNRLAGETSPYLLQHAHNPVDWRPWGEEAFAAARNQDKPIFLSIGYATCHWCHVMERESFESEDVARVLNEVCIPVKVDREERPDIDNIYMQALLALRGGGGWPLSAFIGHDLKPFMLATYLRPEQLIQVCGAVAQHWRSEREALTSHATAIADAIAESTTGGDTLGAEMLGRTHDVLAHVFDPTLGGFGQAPKFPTPHNFSFLLRHYRRTDKESARAMVEQSLAAIDRGGIHDHVAGGFHRYSTDREWRLPHFEKMLYDQALLATAYLEAYQASRDKRFASVARDIFGYVLRDLSDDDGAFYCAEDADSEGEEGKFYVWTLAELERVLNRHGAELIAALFDCQHEGNCQDEATHQPTGANVLHVANPEKFARLKDDYQDIIRPLLDMMLGARNGRVRPLLDDKALTSWNGLMISALALGARVLDEPEYLKAAQDAVNFILTRMRDNQGRLLRSYRKGKAAISAFLDDYAFLAQGLLDLYQSDFNPAHLDEAIALTDQMRKQFEDRERGGFYFSAQGQSDLIVRQKLFHDGALPSGNSIAAIVLLKLAALTGRDEYTRSAEGIFRAAASEIRAYSPAGFTALMMALDLHLNGMREVVIAVPEGADSSPFLAEFRARFLPDTFAIMRTNKSARDLAAVLPFTAEQSPRENKVTAYVCRKRACQIPVTDIDLFRALLDAKSENAASL